MTTIQDIDSALSKRDYSEAEKLIFKLMSTTSNPEVPLKLGHLFYIQKKYSKAEQVYQEILPKTTGDLKAEVLFGLGQTYFETKMFSDSHMAFTLLLNSFPEFPYTNLINLKLARILTIFQDFTNATQYLTKVFNSKKANNHSLSEAIVLLAYINEKQGKKSRATTLFQNAVKINKTFRSLSAFALSLLDSKPQMAEKLCQKVLNKDRKLEEWSDFGFLRALAWMKMKEFEKAEESLEDLVKTFPLNYYYSEYLAIVQARIGKKARALEGFQRLRSLHPFDLTNLKNLAFVYRACGMKEEAARVVTAASFYRNGEEWKLDDLDLEEPVMDLYSFPTNDYN
jgi:tetratricopeptide (TPR) repeat protein